MLILLTALAPEPQVETKPFDPNHQILEMTTDARSTFEAAQAALVPTARRHCAGRAFFLGAFKFVEQPEATAAKRGAAQASFQQELHCSNSELPKSAAAAASGPSDAQQQAVLKATYRYLAAKDSNRLSDAYAMLSQRAKRTIAEPDWIAQTGDFNKQAGAVRARRVTDISWYRDPPEAPEPGLYVAADLTGAFEQVELLCGYVVWRFDADGSYRLVREEQNFLEQRRDPKSTLLDRAPLRAEMGCAD